VGCFATEAVSAKLSDDCMAVAALDRDRGRMQFIHRGRHDQNGASSVVDSQDVFLAPADVPLRLVTFAVA
jgi:hypothetical protein